MYCPECKTLILRRRNYSCPKCGVKIYKPSEFFRLYDLAVARMHKFGKTDYIQGYGRTIKVSDWLRERIRAIEEELKRR